MPLEANVSPWTVPGKFGYRSGNAQESFSTSSHLQPPSESSASSGNSTHHGLTGVASLPSVLHDDYLRPTTPDHLAPQSRINASDRTGELSRSMSGRSLRVPNRSKPPGQSLTPNRTRSTNSTIYSCTFCDSQSTFRSKHEWKRHERSHVPQAEYMCLPKGAIIAFGDRPVCAICGTNEPRADHMVKHKMHLCLHKPPADRTYFRKDKFAKHLRVHGLGLESPQVAHWSRPLSERVLGCGFCVHYFNSFEERSQHIAGHFESGCRKDSWCQSTVIQSLLTQPSVTPYWQSLQSSTLRVTSNSSVSWPESSSTDVLQRRLEDASENGRDLAVAAYNLSSLCLGEAEKIAGDEKPEAWDQSIDDIRHDADPFDLYQME